eukprot:scaffold38040_cov61-Phaeocystis_antarctica.AAC.1
MNAPRLEQSASSGHALSCAHSAHSSCTACRLLSPCSPSWAVATLSTAAAALSPGAPPLPLLAGSCSRSRSTAMRASPASLGSGPSVGSAASTANATRPSGRCGADATAGLRELPSTAIWKTLCAVEK